MNPIHIGRPDAQKHEIAGLVGHSAILSSGCHDRTELTHRPPDRPTYAVVAECSQIRSQMRTTVTGA